VKVPVRTPAAAWQRVDGEMVLMQSDAGELLGLNPVGARAWELIDGVRSIDEIARAIAVEFRADEAEVLRDVEAFFGELAAARLSELVER
jgi:hypothetical protein